MKLKRCSSKQVISALKNHGWMLDRQSGDHTYLIKSKQRVCVPENSNLPIGTINLIRHQAGLTRDEFNSIFSKH